MASGEGPLKYQTHVLKVSIHCEGCKRKLTKILHNIPGNPLNPTPTTFLSLKIPPFPGVRNIAVDSPQNKVTVVVDDNVDAQTLLAKLNKKLGKSGKHAVLWPETKPPTPNPKEKEKEKENEKAPPKPAEPSDPNPPAAAESDTKPAATEATKEPPKSEEKKPQTATPPPAEKPAEATPAATPAADGDKEGEKPADNATKEGGSGSGSGSSKKKDKKKSTESREAAAVSEELAGMRPFDHHPAHPMPIYHQPVYTASYNTAQPTMSYSSYYSPAPMSMPHNYGYSAHPTPMPESYQPPPEHYYGYGEPVPSSSSSSSSSSSNQGSYDMFSDENPNACNLM